jgi:hypothetical protein
MDTNTKHRRNRTNPLTPVAPRNADHGILAVNDNLQIEVTFDEILGDLLYPAGRRRRAS